ncbi:MAG: hypothetical protein A2Y98_04010 [Candidatus Portnoybacteria bacterium RBG_19FT_COMBO_36_7]|uniref:Glycosyltransferase 2-like domain-containing protein n=1 Tax=Candidatus Portnoybacteria bacterium RBG_19FT_COMBO_36_7 TaxID=1801992 RepID=A0A1G2F8Y4_9BACT|nr:MAG: hypothetical protein A2Y98_04010 [Candidatus Portnoybacteria bacterium RBG_19FT_COMBO_36_7]
MNPKVYIIILNWNGCNDTIECIESLKSVTYPNFSVVVVDNASSDNSIDVIPRKYRDIAFIEVKKNMGFAGGNNIGIKYALEHGADYILLLNNDTTVEPNFLSELVNVAQANKKIGILGPKIYFYSEPAKIWFGGGRLNLIKTKGTHIDYLKIDNKEQPPGKPRETRYITGCCLLIKKDTVSKIGMISEDYFLYYEDADWCVRAKKAGWKIIFVPSSVIYHKQSRSTDEYSFPYIYYHSRNGLILGSRFGVTTLTYLLSFLIFTKQIIKLFVGYNIQWAKPVIKGVVDFWLFKKGKLEGYY